MNAAKLTWRICRFGRPYRPRSSSRRQLTSYPQNTLHDLASGCPSTRAIAVAVGTAAVAAAYYFRETDEQVKSSPKILDMGRKGGVHYATYNEMKAALAEIQNDLQHNEDIISTDPEDLLAHGFSEWSSVRLDTLPVAVAYPRSTQEVSVIARVCHKWRVPIVPYSGGSSIEGHTSAPFGGVSIDFLHMDKIVEVHEEDMDVVVQPSVNWVDLNRELERKGTGLFFPIDPAPIAKIGGMIGTNCSGTNAVRYGTMRDWVINATVVLADGSVVKTRQRPRKCSAGYNFNGILVGSEGTLGIVTEATLKLAVIPEHHSVAVIPFKTIRDAVSAASRVIRKGIPVAALELMDGSLMKMVNESKATYPRTWEETPTLFFRFSGSPASVSDNISSVENIVRQYDAGNFEFAKDEQEEKVLWSARKESLWSILAFREENEELYNTDVAVPLSRLADIVEASQKEAEELGLQVFIKGHVGDSNFHENIKYNKQIPEQVVRAKSAVENMVRRAIEMDGTCTGEHGVGYGKKGALLKELGPENIALMKVIKSALDPHWIMNPGKIFDL